MIAVSSLKFVVEERVKPGHSHELQHVKWFQGRGIWSHQFVVLNFQAPKSQPIYIRVERDKTSWLNIWQGNLIKDLGIDADERLLTAESDCIAEYAIHSGATGSRPSYTLQNLGQLIEFINHHSPCYSLSAFNCWWFAGCVFSSIARRLGSDHIQAHRSVGASGREEMTFVEALVFCDTYYVFSRWPYWILIGYIPLVLASFLSFHTDAICATFVALSLAVDGWSVYYLVSACDIGQMSVCPEKSE